MINLDRTLSRLQRTRDIGVRIGELPPGPLNAITDVSGVKVGQVTLVQGSDIRTGVTAIISHPGNLYQEKVPAAIAIGNGYGKLIGYTQVEEFGELETALVLTNTLSAPVAAAALIEYTLQQPGNEDVISVNPVVGETNDGYLNNIRARYITETRISAAITAASDGPVDEGAVGAGTGTVCLGFKGGIGTASRTVEIETLSYTLGVLVQTNFGGNLEIAGVPVGRELATVSVENGSAKNESGSCMIVLATDAPLDARQLTRLARRAFIGLGRTGGIMANGSGDYAIAFSTTPAVRITSQPTQSLRRINLLYDKFLTPFFQAVIESTEEAILNSLFAAITVTGYTGHKATALPLEDVVEVLKRFNRLE
ncbi:MAG: P1 family peptidase [Candidatus Marinimicrobia bacterium]|nr:P1 family peptidase [Candidatus Neomarinimicrobiota bacterium]